MVEDKNSRHTFIFCQQDGIVTSEEQLGGNLKLENRNRMKKMSVVWWKRSC